MDEFSTSDLEAYLDESLQSAEMAKIELALRERPELIKELSMINSRRDAGVHTVGEIWRRHRISCPPREELGGFLLDTLNDEHFQYIKFHLEVVKCRYCGASLEDLRRQHHEANDDVSNRRQKYYKSSAGLLRDKP